MEETINLEVSLDDLKKFHETYNKLYGMGLVGVSPTYVHVDRSLFKKITEKMPVMAKYISKDMIELSAQLDGLFLITLV